MKKLLMAMCSLLLLVACKPTTQSNSTNTLKNDTAGMAKTNGAGSDVTKSEKNAQVIAGPRINGLTLNNINYGEAFKMIGKYRDNAKNDKNPLQQTFFFSKVMIDSIFDLLKTEIDNGKDIDGIRIYFATDVNATDNKNIKLILVSTETSPINKTMHDDYTDHKSNHSLFKLSASVLMGQKGDKNSDKGALLFNACGTGCNTPTGCRVGPTTITRGVATDLVSEWTNTIGPNTTIGVWYSLTTFAFLASYPEFSGIRMYFAKHLKGDTTHKLFKNTIILTPTRLRGSVHEDILKCTDKANFFFNLKKYSKLFNYLKKHGLSHDPEDYGELCPDNCSEGGPDGNHP